MGGLVWEIWQAGQCDPAYKELFQQMYPLEERFEAVMASQDDDIQDAVYDYVMHCEAMSWRMLEFACEYLKNKE